MAELTTKERMSRILQHQDADRVPILDKPWEGTISRWHREGMPLKTDWRDYFNTDKLETILPDITPGYEEEVLEGNKDYLILKTNWGVTMKVFRVQDSTPEFLDYTITNRTAWEDAKRRMLADETEEGDRVNWKWLKREYPKWRQEGSWVSGLFWFGFDVTHSWMMGTETLLVLMIEDPDFVKEIFNTYLDCCIKQFDRIWDAGYHFDWVSWMDDMGYKGTTFFSADMYRELLKPVHKRAVDWAHNHGIYAHLHSCGNVSSFIPELLDIGVDVLNPLEVKAGVDPIAVKQQYGDKLSLHGGTNAVLWDDKAHILAEIERQVPILKQNGGYIFSSDHSIPNTVSLDTFREIIRTVKEVGRY